MTAERVSRHSPVSRGTLVGRPNPELTWLCLEVKKEGPRSTSSLILLGDPDELEVRTGAIPRPPPEAGGLGDRELLNCLSWFLQRQVEQAGGAHTGGPAPMPQKTTSEQLLHPEPHQLKGAPPF